MNRPRFWPSLDEATQRELKYSPPVMHRVALVVVGDFQIMSCAAVAAFDIANFFAGKTFYNVHVISESGGVARSAVGVAIAT